MFYSFPNDPWAAYNGMVLMGQIPGYPEGTPYDRVFATIGFRPQGTLILPYGNENPGFLYSWNAEESILVIGGANAQLAREYYNHHVANPFLTEDRGLHHMIVVWRDEILRLIATNGGQIAPRMTIVGHSLGGAIGVAFYSMKALGNLAVNQMNVTAIGSPRPGTGVLLARSNGWSVVRLFGEADPIPHLIPHASEHPGAHAFLNNAQSLRFNSFEHVGTGYVIRPNGQPGLLDMPDSLEGSIPWELEAWAIGSLVGESRVHGYSYYLRKMELYHRNAVNGIVVPATPFINNPIEPPRGSARSPEVRAARAQFLAREATRQKNPPRLSDVLLAHVEKRVGTYVVVWRKRDIAVCKNRKLAGGIKKDLNHFLAGLANSMSLSTSAWEDAVASFFAAASASGGASVPPLFVSE